ncbi:MAG: U32 family peptidase, partial [Clostridia bacterium]|nr:U32 family peptidase [Clostridia bacterium]
MKKAELLAPAGSIEALKAAVWAGADAVYFGGKAFNARAFAGNFEGEQMKTAIEFCRLYGVKVYITLNTLLSDKEIETALKFVRELEESTPPDAYIVQDLGLVKCLKHAFPELTIHA